jgi:hypothetical protein
VREESFEFRVGKGRVAMEGGGIFSKKGMGGASLMRREARRVELGD